MFVFYTVINVFKAFYTWNVTDCFEIDKVKTVFVYKIFSDVRCGFKIKIYI